MNDARDRSHRLNKTDGIARHGRLPRRSPARVVLELAAATAAVALVSSASVAAIAAQQVQHDLGNGVVIEGQPAPSVHRQELDSYEGGFNLLVVGTDNDATQGEQYGKRDATLNDVNILVHVAADHSNATAVSIPRDLITAVPSCPEPGGGRTSPMSAVPFNSVWAEGGLNCVVQTVQDLTGLKVQFSAKVSFNGVIEMSNAIGGVPVCVDQPITDRDTGLDIPAGTSKLQGTDALAFLRTRHGIGDGSDLGRIASQQVFLSSLLRTVKSGGTLTSAPKLYKLARAAASNMKLSQSLNDLPTMVAMGRALQDLPLDRVNFVQYPGTTNDEGKVIGTEYLADQLFDAIKADQPFTLDEDAIGLGSESAQDAGQAPAPGQSPASGQPTAGQSPATGQAPATTQTPATDGTSATGQSPATGQPPVADEAPTTAETPAAGAAQPTSVPTPSATADTIDGLKGQSAAQQTCSKAFDF